jgi:REase_DpnII-MboI
MPVSLTDEQRLVMQAVYDHFRKNGTWPTFAAIARPLRRDQGIDAAGVIAEFPESLMIPPRQGLRPVDADQIRLTLAGIGQCEGSADDDERFTRLIRWFAEKDLDYDPPSAQERLQVTTSEAAASEAAAYLGIEDDHPALRRLRAMCGLDHLCVSTSGGDENGWTFRIDSDIWRFRHAQDLADLARIRQEWVDQGAAESARRQARAAGSEDEADAPAPVTAAESGSDQAAQLAIITQLLRRFPAVVRELGICHGQRPGMPPVNDEYDVQDLLRAILTGLFGDVRGEETTPSHAGLSSRMDLYLKNEKIVIETKMTRSGLTQRKVAEQLAIDKEFYRSHDGCRALVCFVYDPGHHLRSPASLQNDLTDLSGPVPTIVIVAPSG